MANEEYDIEEAFRVIEDELLESLKRRLEKGIPADITQEDYEAWQAVQLQALQKYRYADSEHFKKKFTQLNSKVEALLKMTANTARLTTVTAILNNITGAKPKHQIDSELMVINRRKLDALINATTSDLEKAEWATLRMVDDQYRKIIYNSQVYLNTGSGSLRQAIDMAAHDFISSGINSIQYKNGARVNIASYSEMALRTANKRAALQGAAYARDEYGLNLVIINYRGTFCSKCSKFVGRVCIDNVYGGGQPDGKHPLLSEFIDGGLYHPNCKDSHSTYYEGITQKPKRPTPEELKRAEEVYQLEQRQRYNERQIRKYKRLEQDQLDPNNITKAAQKRKEWQKIQREFVNAHPELRRKYDREKIY